MYQGDEATHACRPAYPGEVTIRRMDNIFQKIKQTRNVDESVEVAQWIVSEKTGWW